MEGTGSDPLHNSVPTGILPLDHCSLGDQFNISFLFWATSYNHNPPPLQPPLPPPRDPSSCIGEDQGF